MSEINFDFVTQFLVRVFHSRQASAPSLTKASGEFGERIDAEGWNYVNQLDVEPGGGTRPVSALSDASHQWSVRFGPRFIDVNYQQVLKLEGSETQPSEPISFQAFLDRAHQYLKEAIAVFPVTATRLATVRTGLVFSFDIPTVRQSLCTSPGSMPEPFEWDWRCAWKVQRSFDGRSENTNTIASVKGVEANLGARSRDGLLITTDVNTVPENDEPRFDLAALAGFVKESPGWHRDIDSLLQATFNRFGA
ncbi:MAG: hypothetical protein B6A08_04210 [Sorangiineae bacterium NIC37A_2]|nr:MAG: hypothetical protein B6A08_04210 [Sorangiineae bacterium NIC37A_2]